MQGRFSGIGISRPRKQTRREVFLDQMTALVPWARFEQLIRALSVGWAGSSSLSSALDAEYPFRAAMVWAVGFCDGRSAVGDAVVAPICWH